MGDGIIIPPGGSYEIQGYCPTAQINAISASGTNPDVIVVEG